MSCGAPGVGKTVTAMLLGRVTGRKVMRVDLGTVVSKFVGETEKNLAALLHKASARKSWVLFLDEVDALFGKRTNVQVAHDRYADQEASWLLQRVGEFAGIVILGSNFRTSNFRQLQFSALVKAGKGQNSFSLLDCRHAACKCFGSR